MEVDSKPKKAPLNKSQASIQNGKTTTRYNHAVETAASHIFHAYIHPFLSGFFGSLASLIEMAIRVTLFIITLYMNSLMLKFFINSLKRNGATVAKVLSLSVSFFINGVISFFYFKEPFEVSWYVGLLLVMIGIYFLTLDKDRQDNMNHKEIELVETQTSKISLDEQDSADK